MTSRMFMCDIAGWMHPYLSGRGRRRAEIGRDEGGIEGNGEGPRWAELEGTARLPLGAKADCFESRGRRTPAGRRRQELRDALQLVLVRRQGDGLSSKPPEDARALHADRALRGALAEAGQVRVAYLFSPAAPPSRPPSQCPSRRYGGQRTDASPPLPCLAKT